MMKGKVFILVGICFFVSGCESLRFAPSEEQKENAWLHNRTAVATAEVAQDEVVSN
jgi:hypothetical protein